MTPRMVHETRHRRARRPLGVPLGGRTRAGTARPPWRPGPCRPAHAPALIGDPPATRRGCPGRPVPVASEKPPEDLSSGEVCLRDRWRHVVAGQGHHGREHRPAAQEPGPLRLHPQARPVHQRRPRHHVALPARRGVRHRRRRRDGPRPGSLRAVHRREPDPVVQRHHGAHLPGGHRQGAPRRLPRRHGPGHPPHHQRDQGAHRPGRPRRPRRRGHRGGRRHGRRHRVAAVPGSHPPDAQGRRPRQRAVRPRDAAARSSRRPGSSRPSPPSTRSRSCAASASSRTSSSPAATCPWTRTCGTRSRCSATCPGTRSSRAPRRTPSTRCRCCSSRSAWATWWCASWA